jgi:hypothetical protein
MLSAPETFLSGVSGVHRARSLGTSIGGKNVVSMQLCGDGWACLSGDDLKLHRQAKKNLMPSSTH